jgi:putative transposase
MTADPAQIRRHKTAIVRGEYSAPIRAALHDGLIGTSVAVLDCGCGRGDVDRLAADESWRADITDIPTGEGGLYLAVVEDLFSRLVVGGRWTSRWRAGWPWVPWRWRSPAGVRVRPGAGLLAHSDRGSRYASDHDQRVLASEGIVCRMGGVGRCWDNAPVESFFGRRKCEIEPGEVFATRDQARAVVFEYLEVFYNRVRLHSSPGFLSPADSERTDNQTHR